MNYSDAETKFFWRLSRATTQFLAKDPHQAAGDRVEGDTAVEWLDELSLFLTHCDAPALRVRAKRLFDRLAAWLASAGIVPAY